MIIDKMDYIFAIAKEQNLTRAAKRLFVAQSTLTMYLNRVEAELGVKLFDRSKTPILPTPAGALCIEELKKIRQIETRLSAKLQQMAHPEETLNVGIGLMHSAAWMPQLLPLFHEIYPDVRINLIEQGDELLLQSLQRRRCGCCHRRDARGDAGRFRKAGSGTAPADRSQRIPSGSPLGLCGEFLQEPV